MPEYHFSWNDAILLIAALCVITAIILWATKPKPRGHGHSGGRLIDSPALKPGTKVDVTIHGSGGSGMTYKSPDLETVPGGAKLFDDGQTVISKSVVSRMPRMQFIDGATVGSDGRRVVFQTGFVEDDKFITVSKNEHAKAKGNAYGCWIHEGIDKPKYMIGFGSAEKARNWAIHAAEERGWNIGTEDGAILQVLS